MGRLRQVTPCLHFPSGVVLRSRHCPSGCDTERTLEIEYKTQILQRRILIQTIDCGKGSTTNTRRSSTKRINMQRLIASAFILVFATRNSAELSSRGFKLAETVGLRLGLPLNSGISGNRSKAVPDFLLDVYACWSSHSPSTNCSPYPQALPKSLLEGVNVVRAVKGRVIQPTKVAVLSRNLNYVLMTPFDFKFNLTLIGEREEKLHLVYITVPKRALNRADLEAIKAKCDVNSGVQLLLHVQVKTSDTTQDIVTLSTMLSSDDINQQLSLNFTDTTQHFQKWLEHSSTSNAFHIVQGRIVVGGGCYGLINPVELGIGSSTEKSPWIVIIGEHMRNNSDKNFLRASLVELAAETSANYQKRDTSHTTMAQNGNQNSDTEPVLHSHSDDSPCQHNTHTLSFADLGWSEYILSPGSFEINNCLGRCTFPQITHPNYNTTKQSYIQSLGAYYNPELVPQPCCVPHEYSNVTVIYFEQTSDTPIVRKWENIAAMSCGCK